jgi:SAM-dependent methyltransferase
LSIGTQLQTLRPTNITVITACRACGCADLIPVIVLGPTPLANSLLPPGETQARVPLYPLDVVRCADCSLVQIIQVVSPTELFSDYVYFSSFSDALLEHAHAMTDALVVSEHLDHQSLVLEIASNDGYLLQFFKSRGVPVLGVEPAQNIAQVAEDERGIPTLNRFFDAALAEELAAHGQLADVVIGNNVLAHVPDLNSFVEGVRRVLRPDGVAVFEVPYLKEMLDGVEFDTIYHEHQCYFSATALSVLFARHSLDLYDLERQPIHGGSLRVFAAPLGTRSRSQRLLELLDEETAWGVRESHPYATFAENARRVRDMLVELVRGLKQDGARIAAYGAAAKGVTLLSFCGLGAEHLDFVVDRSTYKQGRRFPVGALPILPAQALVEEAPDYALLLTWNFAKEILSQQANYRAAGGRFIIPVPDPKII